MKCSVGDALCLGYRYLAIPLVLRQIVNVTYLHHANVNNCTA